LRVVAEEGAAAGRYGASSAEHVKVRRTLLLFDRRVLQAEMDQRLRRIGKIGGRAADADVAAEIKPAPAGEGGGSDCEHRCLRLATAAQDRKIVVGGERVRRLVLRLSSSSFIEFTFEPVLLDFHAFQRSRSFAIIRLNC
jgi:hypothetical protein